MPRASAEAAARTAQQILDVIFTTGCYETTSWLFRSAELDPDLAVPELLARYRRPPEGGS